MDPSIYPLTIYYESACPLCTAEMAYLRSRDKSGLLRFEDISAPGFSAPAGVTCKDLLRSIHAMTAEGALLQGVEVLRLAYRAVGLGWLVAPTRLRFVGPLCERFYAAVARNRHRIPRRLFKELT